MLCGREAKTTIQALDRKDWMLPLAPGRAESHGFEYKRNGRLSRFAALNTSTGEVLGETAARQTSAQFVSLLEEIVFSPFPRSEIHVSCDNFSSHKTALVQTFLAKRRRVHDEYKLVFSQLGDRLRIARTAELNGYDRHLNSVRCDAIVHRTEELFPGAGDLEQAGILDWPSASHTIELPIIGRSTVPNLFFNTGHGTLGWTHCCGLGKSIARIISGMAPELEFSFVGMQ